MEQLLGIVGFEDRGNFVLGEQYEYLNIVSTADGCYFAKKDNKDMPLTDEDTWKQFSRLGADGKNIELGINSTHLQWRLEGDANWIDLIALSSLKGADGKELEIRTENGYIQTRLTGEGWSDLVDLENLKGPQGDRGLQGKPLVVLSNGHYGYWDEDSADYIDSGIEASATLDIENAAVSFTEAATRDNLQTGENVPTLFGKIKKWFNDLGALAWKTKVDYTTDIDNLPIIPEAQIQSDWSQADGSKKDFIQNKPAIPTKTSELTNDSGFTTDASVTSKINVHNADGTAHDDIRLRISGVESSRYNHTQSDERYVQKESGKGLSEQNFTTDYKSLLDFFLKTTTVASLSAIQVNSQTIYVNINSNQTLSLTGQPPAGQPIHLYIKNTASSNLTITIPAGYINMSGSSISLPASGRMEISVVYDLNENNYKLTILEGA